MTIPKLMAISDARARRWTGPGNAEDHPEDHCEDRFEALLNQWVEAGVDSIQIREKGAQTRTLFRMACRAVESFGERLNILINGKADVAIAAGAHGVHLPARGVPPAAIRKHFGDRLTIGVSTHSLDEIRQAADQGADYVTFSPIYATPSKARFGPPQGLPALREAAALGLPVIALGGISPQVIGEVLAAGSQGVAAIRAFHHQQTLDELMEAYRRVSAAGAS